ncbi:MAG: tetratricopeptide repeat protein [Streptomyces sp.]|nr:tetratricopeptide repeat protein [Streptomyces sp.]
MAEQRNRVRTGQKADAGSDVTQVTGGVHVTVGGSPPAADPEIEWPVWTGTVPPLAAAFQPRTAVREQIANARAGTDRPGLSQVLVGNGGVGKSQLVAALTRDLRDEDRSEGHGIDVLVWVKASEPDQIITAYAEAAERLRLPGSTTDDTERAARAFLDWLAATERRWLIVLDDITDPAAADVWWPDGNPQTGRVLATTRRGDAMLSGKGRTPIPLDLYTEDEARAYLRRRLTDAGHPGLYASDTATPLAEELGRLPLALGHAAAYMINKRCTTTAYLTRFRDTTNHLGDLLPPDADTEGYGQPVTTALLISLTAVQETDTTQLAHPLLHLIAHTDPLGHPAELWTTPPALEYLRTARPAVRRRLRRHHPPVTTQQVQDALDCLRTYALVSQDTVETPVRIHALTARAVRETLAADAVRGLAHAVADALVSIWPEYRDEDRELIASLRGNAQCLDELTSPALWQPDIHNCFYRASSSLTAAGLLNQAIAHDEATARQCVHLHGPDHPDTLLTRNNLANSYSDAGRAQEALNLREQVLTDQERILGPDHPDTLRTRHNLAALREATAGLPQPGGTQPGTSSPSSPPSTAPDPPA